MCVYVCVCVCVCVRVRAYMRTCMYAFALASVLFQSCLLVLLEAVGFWVQFRFRKLLIGNMAVNMNFKLRDCFLVGLAAPPVLRPMSIANCMRAHMTSGNQY